MDHLILARRPNLELINKKKRLCRLMNFAIPMHHREKLKEYKYLHLARELKRLWKMNVDVISIVGALGTLHKIWKRDCGNWRWEKELRPSDHSSVKIRLLWRVSWNLRRLVIQTSVKNHLFKQVWKTHIEWKNGLLMCIGNKPTSQSLMEIDS